MSLFISLTTPLAGCVPPKLPGMAQRRSEGAAERFNKRAATQSSSATQQEGASEGFCLWLWLVMADSWRETVKLQEMLTRQAEFIRKVPMPRASGA